MKATFVVVLLWQMVSGQERRPTISFITQPEIVTDIGGTVRSDRCFPKIIYLLKSCRNKFYELLPRSVKSSPKKFPKMFP
jgi:hypothetical protein